MPPMVRAEISQSMLKHSDDNQVSIFTARVLNFINPKFDDPDSEMPLAEVELYAFARSCELTCDEFLLALELAADGKLYSEPDDKGTARKIQLFREIDRLKLGEVKAAYLHHKKIDKQYETGKARIKAFLEPPTPELTPEQKKAERTAFYKADYARLQKDETVLGTVIFYDLIKKNGVEKVNLKFLEAVLDRYQPETFESGLSVSKVGSRLEIPRKVTHNAKTHFINSIVKAYFDKEKLKDLTESQFIEYWENINQKTD